MNEPRFERKPAENERGDDFLQVVVDGHPASVFRPLIKGVRREKFYVKGYPPGSKNKAFYRCTGFAQKTPALDAARKLWKAALGGRWVALEQTKLRGEAPAATVGEILEAHEKHIHRVNLTLRRHSAAGYRNSLRRVVAWARLGGLQPGWQAKAESLSGTVLDGDLVRDYLAQVVPMKELNPKAHEQKLRGALRTLALARQMFAGLGRRMAGGKETQELTGQARKCYAGLALPAKLWEFLERPAEKAPRRRHEPLADAAVREMAAAALGLKESNPALYAVHLLFRHCGLRNDEIVHARGEWIVRLADPVAVFLPNGERREVAAFLEIRTREYWAVKVTEGRVPISADVLAELESVTGRVEGSDRKGKMEEGRAFLIPALTVTDRWELVNVAHNDFVRPWTEHLQKRSYELRRWAGTKVRMMHRSREMGDIFLRHAPTSVGELNYFTDAPVPAPITLGDVGL